MIIDNYTNTLPENRETELDYIIPKSPILTVRQFKFDLLVNEPLIIPYYVNVFDDTEYRDNKIGDTFTTIIRLDEDTIEDSQVIEYKQTTFSGEQIIDLGLQSAGIHSFSIRTIQSNGVSSGTQYFKFIVKEPIEQSDYLDLNGINTFQSVNNYDGKVKYGNSKTFYFDGESIVNPISTQTGSKIKAAYKSKITNNASYKVTLNKVQGKIKYIKIEVNGGIEYEPLVNPKYNHTIDITGVYYLTTVYKDSNNVEHLLSDLLNTPADELPKEAVITAAKNKIALTRLLEACKATGYKGVLLPKLDLVLDYHSADGSKTLTYSDKGRCDIEFPDNFIIDFNNSTLSALQTIDLHNGRLFWLIDNINTHIRNINLVGNYKNYDYIKSRTSGAGKTSEALSVFSMSKCSFCSIKNADISYSVGYEFTFGEDIPGSLGGDTRAPFDNTGYIDSDGNIHNIPTVGDINSIEQYWYTSDYSDIPIRTKYVPYYQNRVWNHFRFCRASSVNGGYNGVTRREYCDEFFIHYYDSEKQFIKTVKVQMQDIIIPPLNAVYFRLSAIGVMKSGLLDTLNKSDGTCGIILCSNANSFCNVAEDCKVHDTRSCLGLYSGNQQLVKGMRVWNIAQDPTIGGELNFGITNFGITTLLVDIEDMSWVFNNIYIEDFEYLYGDVRAFNVIFSHKLDMNNCRNLGLVFKEIDRGRVNNSSNCSLRLVDPAGNFARDLYIQFDNCHFTRVSNNRNPNKCRSNISFRNTVVQEITGDVTIKNN